MKKSIFLKISLLILIIGSFLVGTTSCIEVEDEVKPEITFLEMDSNYGYLDSFKVDLKYFDNIALYSYSIKIAKVGSTLPEDWTLEYTETTGGRFLEYTFRELVPNDVTKGQYSFTVEIMDHDGNTATLSQNFSIVDDFNGPNITGLDYGLLKNADDVYIACPLQIIPLKGIIIDPALIESVNVQFGDIPSTPLVGIGKKSFNLETELSISVPSSAEVGNYYPLVITATDQNGNESTWQTEVFIDCDNVAPVVTLEGTTPEVTVTGTNLNVIAGTVFDIGTSIITDNKLVDSVFIYFDLISSTSPNLILSEEVKSASVDLNALLTAAATTIEIPNSANPGDIYLLMIEATDESGNVSDLYEVLFTVIEDLPPFITVTQVYRNGTGIGLPTAPFAAVADEVISFDAKATDDIGLDSVSITLFDPTGLEVSKQLQADISTPTLVTLFNLNTLTAPDPEIRIPSPATTGTYTIVIRAIDTGGQEYTKTYSLLL